MADITLYGLKTCDTCRKAIKVITAAGHSLTVRDVRADGVAAEDLAEWIDLYGEAVINTRSATWRGLDEAERARKETDPVGLLSDHPTLIKRPVIVDDDTIWVGWSKETEAAMLACQLPCCKPR